jgi:hypothetical protein
VQDKKPLTLTQDKIMTLSLNIQKYNTAQGTKGFIDLTNSQIDLLMKLEVNPNFQKNEAQEDSRLSLNSFPDQNGTNGLGRWFSYPFSKKADRKLYKPGLRASVIIISEMKCAYITRKDRAVGRYTSFNFGVYDQQFVSIDHLIARRKLFYGIVKGIVIKENVNALSNLRLSRSSINKSKGEISRYLKMKDLSYDKDHLERSLIILREFLGSQPGKDEKGKQVFCDLDPEFKLILAEVNIPRTRLIKLVIWYKVHEILNTPFYQNNEDSAFVLGMIKKHHT